MQARKEVVASAQEIKKRRKSEILARYGLKKLFSF
jgi:hypothetical protein